MTVLVCLLASLAAAPQNVETTGVAPVWAGHPVGFALLTHDSKQFVAYYDVERRMTVASRELGSRDWTKVVLPESVVWDSHNYITMAVDDTERLHLSGNMHGDPLVYFRTVEPLDITTFERAPMVGEREDRVTYPKFMRGLDDVLIFTYRDGSSGRGDQIYNVYDAESQTWRRLLDTPLLSGQDKMNAYLNGPVKGPDGQFHLCWVWRDHPGCESNHDPSYARSADLVHWYTGEGEALTLPITLDDGGVVDPVPPGGGVINGNVKVGFDGQQRPIVSYHKHDEAGHTQIYNARLEDGQWVLYQTSDWAYRWDFSGGGSIVFEIRLSAVEPHKPGTLRQSYSHSQYGSAVWELDEKTLKPIGTIQEPSPYPAELRQVESDFPGMQIRRSHDLGSSPEPGTRYVLQWETLGHNRDKPREGPLPGPSMLRVIELAGRGVAVGCCGS